MNQKGFAPVLLMVVIVGVLAFVSITAIAPFKNNLLSAIFPKDSSKAAEPASDFTGYVSTFRLQNSKSEMEKFLNPFGETWESKQSSNPNIPVLLAGAFDRTKSASYGLTDRAASFSRLLPNYAPKSYPEAGVNYYLELTEGYKNLLRNANTNYTFFNQGGGVFTNRPRYSMPSSNIVIRELDKINPNLKHNSYYAINFVEEADLAGYDNLQEDWYVHKKGTDASKPENRLKVGGGGQFILDVTKPGLQVQMATGVAKAMQDNQLDWLLVDGAGGSTYRPSLAAGDTYPDYFSPQAYFTGTLQTLGALKAKLNPLGKEIIFNPIQPDAIDDNRIAQVRQYLEVTDGAYWENPFRKGNRDYFASTNGPDYYYTQLQKFFDVANEMNKKLIIESDTVIELRQDKPDYCPLMFQCEYQKLLDEKGYYEVLRYEQRVERLHLALYLLYLTNPQTNIYSHYTLAEPLSYETSEANFADYDLKIGKPLAKMEKVADNIYKRQFENGQVWVNYSKQAYTVGPNILTCDDYYQSICQKPHFVTAEGIPVLSYTLQPETAMIFVANAALEPFNPSFETVWNWKPNQMDWGKVDYTKSRTGRTSFNIPPNSTGSPGLTQGFKFKPNTQYQWSAYVKTENSNKAKITAAFAPIGTTSTTGKTVPISSGVYIYNDTLPLGTNDWTQIKFLFSTGAQGGDGNFYVVGEAGNTGNVWFDNVYLLEVGPVLSPSPVPSPSPTIGFSNSNTSSYCLTPTQVRLHIQWNSLGGTTYYKVYINNADGTKTTLYDGDGIAMNYDTAQSGKTYSLSLDARTNWNGTYIGSASTTVVAAICQAPSPSPSPSAAIVQTVSVTKLEHAVKPNYFEKFYTVKANEIQYLKDRGWTAAGTAFKSPIAGTADAIMAKRMYLADNVNNAQIRTWAVVQSDIDSLVGQGYLQSNDSDFYAYTTQKTGTVGVTRMKLFSSTYNKTFYTFTVNQTEINTLTSQGWSVDKSNVFYVYP